MTVTRIEMLPTGADFTFGPTKPFHIAEPNEYVPEANKLRTDMKELIVVQPNGVSFTVDGDVICWQKWEFRLTFNYREGWLPFSKLATWCHADETNN
jgi:primary-amine oxidase